MTIYDLECRLHPPFDPVVLRDDAPSCCTNTPFVRVRLLTPYIVEALARMFFFGAEEARTTRHPGVTMTERKILVSVATYTVHVVSRPWSSPWDDAVAGAVAQVQRACGGPAEFIPRFSGPRYLPPPEVLCSP